MNKRWLITLIFLFIHFMTMSQTLERTLEELTADTSGINLVKEWAANSKNKVEFLPVDRKKGDKTLLELQVTTRSPMGAIAYFTGGIFIDDGWLRILGSESEKLNRSIVSWNKGKTYIRTGEQPKFLLIADDIAGGFFAINSGALGSDIGKIYYLAPDTLKWEALDLTYTDFINFCFNGNVAGFYKELRWKSWKEDIKAVSGEQAFSFFPFLWTKEGKDINSISKKPVSIEEIYSLNIKSN